MKIIFVLGMFAATFADAAEIKSSLLASDSGSSKFISKPYVRFSVLSSRSGNKGDFRSFRTSGSDDGSVSEQTTLPNLSFVAAFGSVNLARSHQLMVAAMQGINKEEDKRVATPFGANIQLPSRIALARYRYLLNENLSFSASMMHVDTFGYMDPNLGVQHKNMRSWGALTSDLQLSAPVTEKSRADQLYTRATARLSAMHRYEKFTNFGRLSHSRPFYRDPENLDKPVSNARSGPSSARPTSLPAEVDLVLMQRETSRSIFSLGSAYQLTDRFRFSSSGNLILLTTLKNEEIWLSTFRPLGATYSKNSWEVSLNFGLTSDVRKYKSPSLPSQWIVSGGMSYFFGEPVMPL
jgi:hypothetical protein